jgi:alanine racemase
MAVKTPAGTRRVSSIGMTESRADAWPGVEPGDEVIVFGAGSSSATDLAETIGTVGEEILVRVSPTVPREIV